MSNFSILEKQIKHVFKNQDLLKHAFIHRSYLNENKEIQESNERLEFLGDAILQFLTSEYLFSKYPNNPEGLLTSFRSAVVRTESLAEESSKLNFGEYLFLSKGEEQSGGRSRPYILANTFEAFLGAMYLDNLDINTCRKFLEKTIFPKIETVVATHKYKDNKSAFQEIAQEKTGVTPIYKILEEWGPDHDKKFKAGVYIKSQLEGTGEGQSKQRAEENAAEDALKKWQRA